MIGFVYLWYDRKRKMFCLGSHKGRENDGYVTGTGGQHFKNAYRKRPQDFKRRIIERVYEGDVPEIRAAEQRWLDMIKVEELSIKGNLNPRYYNITKNVRGFDSTLARIAGAIANSVKDSDGKSSCGRKGMRKVNSIIHAEKDENGKSIAAIRLNIIIHSQKDIDGKSLSAKHAGITSNSKKDIDGKSKNARMGGIASHYERNEEGKSMHAIKMGIMAHAIKNDEGKSSHAIKRANIMHKNKTCNGKSIFALRANHIRWHLQRNVVCQTCELCK